MELFGKGLGDAYRTYDQPMLHAPPKTAPRPPLTPPPERVEGSPVPGHTGVTGDSESYPTLSGGGDLGLQTHYIAPEAGLEQSLEPRGDDAGGLDWEPQGSPSLVSTTGNSPSEAPQCPHARWITGTCTLHHQQRWVLVPCKKRTCETCGPAGRYQIAQRIALGVRRYWPCVWLVLTWQPSWPNTRSEARTRLQAFRKYLRKRMPGLQYAATYELTKLGQLHINLIAGPWDYIDQADLQRAWGARVWVEWVKDQASIGVEAAAAYTPEALGGYLSKLEQAVPTSRRVSYSKGWPKLPHGGLPRTNVITWTWPNSQTLRGFAYERDLNLWLEALPGEYAFIYPDPDCNCFNVQLPLFPLDPKPT